MVVSCTSAMSTKIKSLDEAVQAIDGAVDAFGKIAEVAIFLRSFKTHLLSITGTTPDDEAEKADSEKSGATPATALSKVDCVLKILREAKTPLRVAEIKDEYERRKYPAPTNGSHYSLVSGTVGYLYSKKNVLIKHGNAYAIASKNFESNRAPERPLTGS
jgi:hypothetical protein